MDRELDDLLTEMDRQDESTKELSLSIDNLCFMFIDPCVQELAVQIEDAIIEVQHATIH